MYQLDNRDRNGDLELLEGQEEPVLSIPSFFKEVLRQLQEHDEQEGNNDSSCTEPSAQRNVNSIMELMENLEIL